MASGEGEVADLARAVRDVYRQAEDALLGTVAERIRRGHNLDEPFGALAQAQDLAGIRGVAERIVDRLNLLGIRAAYDVLTKAQTRGREQGDRDIRNLLGRNADDYGSPVNLGALGTFAKALVDQLRPAHDSILRTTADAYRDAVSAIMVPKLVGAANRRRDASQRALDALADRGVSGFVDKAGRRWALESYAEMAVRTAGARVMVEAHMDRLGAAGLDLVYTNDAPQECYLCRPWEGRVLHRVAGPAGKVKVKSMTGPDLVTVDVAGSLPEARAAGFQHPNCRHSVSAYLPGATRLPKATADPEGDAARQRHRELERLIRKWKRRELTAVDADAKADARAKTKAWQAELRDHLDRTGLIRQPKREQVAMGHTLGRPTPGKRDRDDADTAARAAAPSKPRPDLEPDPNPEPDVVDEPTPEPTPELAPADTDPTDPGREPADLTDDEIEAALSASLTAEDFDRFEALSEESDARDTAREAAAAAERRRTAKADADRERRAAAKAAAEEEAWTRAEALIDQGWPEDEAVAEAYGRPLDAVRRENAVAVLRGQGYTGGGFDELSRQAFADYLEEEHIRAEDAVRGHMLNPRAEREGIPTRELFLGPERVARARASEELLAYWDEQGRYTLDLFRDELVNGSAEARRRFGIRGDFLQ